MVKRILKISVLTALILVLCVYSVMLWFSEGINRYDVTEQVNLVTEERRIELPWYLSGAELYHSRNGADASGNGYTKFYYELPVLLETEMECVVSWTDGTAVLYIGESRGMDVIDLDYPDVEWN